MIEKLIICYPSYSFLGFRIRIRIRFFPWIRIRFISDRIRNPANFKPLFKPVYCTFSINFFLHIQCFCYGLFCLLERVEHLYKRVLPSLRPSLLRSSV